MLLTSLGSPAFAESDKSETELQFRIDCSPGLAEHPAEVRVERDAGERKLVRLAVTSGA